MQIFKIKTMSLLFAGLRIFFNIIKTQKERALSKSQYAR